MYGISRVARQYVYYYFALRYAIQTAREQRPGSRHEGATSMHTHPAVRRGWNWRPKASSPVSLPSRLDIPLIYAEKGRLGSPNDTRCSAAALVEQKKLYIHI